MQLDLRDLAPFALLAPVIAFWSQIKGYLNTVRSFGVRTDKVGSQEMWMRLLPLLLDRSRILRVGDTNWKESGEYVKALGFQASVTWAGEHRLFVLYRGWRPLWLTSGGHGGSVTYIVGTLDFESLLAGVESELLNWYKANDSKRRPTYYHYRTLFSRELRNSGDTVSPGEETESPKPALKSARAGDDGDNSIFGLWELQRHARMLSLKFSDIGPIPDDEDTQRAFYWTPEALALRRELSYFVEHASWFLRKRLRYQRGALLYGQPGTGKSKMIIECAKAEQVAVTHIFPAGMTNKEFRKAFEDLPWQVSIILVEDVDCMFDGRENQQTRRGEGSLFNPDPLTLDTVLDCLSRTEGRRGGIFVIMTTNHKDRLDPALLRPGRLDLHLEVPRLPAEGRQFIADHILGDLPAVDPAVIRQQVAAGEGETAAEFENRCITCARETLQAQAAAARKEHHE